MFGLFRLEHIILVFRVLTQHVNVQHLIYCQGQCVCDALLILLQMISLPPNFNSFNWPLLTSLQKTRWPLDFNPNNWPLLISFQNINLPPNYNPNNQFLLILLQRIKWTFDSNPNNWPLLILLQRIMWTPNFNPNNFPFINFVTKDCVVIQIKFKPFWIVVWYVKIVYSYFWLVLNFKIN